jgi:hypothetical protein
MNKAGRRLYKVKSATSQKEEWMKKSIIYLAACFLLLTPAYSQNVHEKGTVVLQGGAGLGLVGLYGTISVPPISVSLDYGMTNEISVGVYAGYSSSKETLFEAMPPYLPEDVGLKYGYTLIGVRGSYHFNLENKKIDAYGTAMFGYNIVSASSFGLGQFGELATKGSYAAFGASLGIRYFFTPKIALFGEAGYGVEYIRAGLSFKL